MIKEFESKEEMRKHFRALRAALDPMETASSGSRICQQLMCDPAILNAESLLLYSAIGREVDLMPLARWALAQGKRIAYPRCQGREMTFYAIDDFSQLSREGSFHIREPEGEVPFIPDAHSVMLTPGTAFSEKGARLGMGGGYYDRYLARYPDLYTIGVCHSCQLTDDWPLEPWDRRMDRVVFPH